MVTATGIEEEMEKTIRRRVHVTYANVTHANAKPLRTHK
jgi:hypothetical protein